MGAKCCGICLRICDRPHGLRTAKGWGPLWAPAVGFLVPTRKLGLTPRSLPLDDLIWPLGQPDRLHGRQLRNLAPTDHFVIPPRTTSFYRPGFSTRARVSVMVLEPKTVQARHIGKLTRLYTRFDKILTFSPRCWPLCPMTCFMWPVTAGGRVGRI